MDIVYTYRIISLTITGSAVFLLGITRLRCSVAETLVTIAPKILQGKKNAGRSKKVRHGR